jgi:hypothetical protein
MPHVDTTIKPTQPAATLPGGIEIFRAGVRTDDAGNTHTITEAMLAQTVAAYDPALHEAPHTVGHPKHNMPAYGWVERLAANGGVLQVESSKQVEPQFAEMVADGRVKKRSSSFYHPKDPANPVPGVWYLRHVAWLGAQPPAVKGLKDVAFSEGGFEAVCFSESIPQPKTPPEHSPMDEDLKAQLAQAQKDLAAAKEAAAAATRKADEATAQAASFAEKARADRKAGFVSFAEAQAQAGTLLPKDKAMAVATLEALADAQPVEFSEGDTTRKLSPAQWLQDLIAGGKPHVQFGEFAGGRAPAGAGGARGKTDAEIDQAAKAWMVSNKVNYAEALKAVTSSFTS